MSEAQPSAPGSLTNKMQSRDEHAGFQLTHVLRGHTSDVRSVATTFDSLSGREALLSGSRDETATYWSRPVPLAGEPNDASASTFAKGATFHGKRFCNAVAFVPPSPSMRLPRGHILMGSLDAQIRCFDPLRADKPLQLLSEHWDNISVLATYDRPTQDSDTLPVFVSGSWDKTARVWVWDAADGGGRWQCRLVLRGHDEAVWGVQIVEPPSFALLQPKSPQAAPVRGQGRYLTSSADLFIRLFHGDQLHAVYAGHTDVVRSLRLLPPLHSTTPTLTEMLSATPAADPALYPDEALFASTSNDATVRIWSLDPRRSPNPGNGGEALRVLRGHESLVYDVAAFLDQHSQAPRLVSSGEDGSIRIWDWRSGALLQTVAVPVVSVWSIAVLPRSQDVVVGCSDTCVRVYSRRAPATRPLVDSHFGGAPLSDAEVALQDEKANDVQQARSRLAVEATQPSGESADTEAGGPESGELWQGQRYDLVLRIDVADDAEPLPLPINRADDRQRAASDFVALHKLPESYIDKIVDFINLVLG